ncbi:N(4)-(beta-N-acetylglucosaminyl)-L-asparaginase [Salmonella enterica subsp. indica]|uniref:N(4)-(Beta-N-acetylglucosaminyl)-L-asparaginase n=2 Tax=Salmonella enterica TaxID=28901 RepID=A0A5Y2QPY6_SALER|nr:N(4)-(beta-N-acetylglucosaminyl)-L-asparaginase [Salmonella enterica]EBP3214671.1 N(4)-(beta-N-acetylglucosaminyl)-L-asparaginase [Salmonella enterica subsp. arizonae]ECI8273413.1 N(4)-(beta-N-acetylglucosaminyl)-L-asparaginase [Salmonella enterica subsp. enterica]EDR2772449.1 N(4)-(beta-N-acetylglucosaminyl)-L-asparaginase [Salmonella enterica subsp. enterica serovar Oslo]EEC4250770.1 N(4)-(beta-N-acetylglucosaminyl)-L-asparaginase [Salmonella enterica subsp. diarizonae]ECC3877953.1 N(4)-(
MGNTLIATWRMALDGLLAAAEIVDVKEAVLHAVRNVENNPCFHSVGYGGLPAENGEVELDAAFMDGDTLDYGAVAAVRDLKNPVMLARYLSQQQRNNVLCGAGAFHLAVQQSMETRDNRYHLAQEKWRTALQASPGPQPLEAYDGHDTVCILGRAPSGSVCAGVSTSGLFMKKPGRIGDSPVIGSGCYADSEMGAAAATGVGEDIMKGCLSWEIVRLMERHSPQEACDIAVKRHTAKLLARRGECGSISVIALNRQGKWGAATNKDEFSFVVAEPGKTAQVWLAHNQRPLERASAVWLNAWLSNLTSGSGG